MGNTQGTTQPTKPIVPVQGTTQGSTQGPQGSTPINPSPDPAVLPKKKVNPYLVIGIIVAVVVIILILL
jgi:hypothetical protein